MEKQIRRITNSIIIVFAAIAVIAALIVLAKGAGSPAMNVDFYIIYIMAAAAILLIILFAVIQILSNKKLLLQTLALLGVCLVVVLVSYFSSSSQLSETAIKVGVSEGMYKLSGTLLNVAYIAFAGVVAALLGSILYVNIKR